MAGVVKGWTNKERKRWTNRQTDTEVVRKIPRYFVQSWQINRSIAPGSGNPLRTLLTPSRSDKRLMSGCLCSAHRHTHTHTKVPWMTQKPWPTCVPIQTATWWRHPCQGTSSCCCSVQKYHPFQTSATTALCPLHKIEVLHLFRWYTHTHTHRPSFSHGFPGFSYGFSHVSNSLPVMFLVFSSGSRILPLRNHAWVNRRLRSRWKSQLEAEISLLIPLKKQQIEVKPLRILFGNIKYHPWHFQFLHFNG